MEIGHAVYNCDCFHLSFISLKNIVKDCEILHSVYNYLENLQHDFLLCLNNQCHLNNRLTGMSLSI